jgi:hypothetical protein
MADAQKEDRPSTQLWNGFWIVMVVKDGEKCLFDMIGILLLGGVLSMFCEFH